MEQTVATLSSDANLSNPLIKPVTVREVVLLAPGIWTGTDGIKTRYSPEGVRNGFLNSNWEDMNLFLDHKDSEGTAAAYWIGFIRNARMVGQDLVGDLEIWHPLFSMFIKTAKAKFGVSMTMNGREYPNVDADYSDFDISSYRSGSLVDEPGCEASWLPKMLGKGDKNSKTVCAGEVSLDNIKSLSNHNHSSEKSLASNDAGTSNEDNCKGVKKMTEDKVNQEKSTEEQEEAKTEEKSTEEAKSETAETAGNEDVKKLGAKVDKLTDAITSFVGVVQKSLAAGDEDKEKAKEEAKTKEDEESAKSEAADGAEAGDDSKDDELESTKNELEETKKELAKAKAEADEPDEKSLAAGGNSANAGDSNQGMLNFLREKLD
jgi:hypothetical protein